MLQTRPLMQDKLSAKGSKVKALVAAPGLAASNLQATTAEHGGGAGLNVLMKFSQSEEDGAMPLLECATAPGLAGGTLVLPGLKGFGGMLFGDGIRGPPVTQRPEPICTSGESKAMLWTASEAAVGPFFK
jgi:hypothetical protein